MDAKRFARDFADALKVMWAFNGVFGIGPGKRRESDLPFGKGRIAHALIYINAAIHTEETWRAIRQAFPKDAADLYLSEQFSAGLMAQLFGLPDFLRDDEADLRDRVDRSLGHRLGPDGLYAPQSAEEQKACMQRMMGDPIGRAEFNQWVQIQQRIHAEGETLLEQAKAFTLF